MGYCLTPKDGGGSNIPYFHPYLGKIDPFRLIFSVGLKPPPSIFGSVLYIHLYRRFNGGADLSWHVCRGMQAVSCPLLLFHAPQMDRRLAYRVQAKRKPCCQVSLSSGHRRYPNILEASKSCTTYNFLNAATPNVVSATEAYAYQNQVPSLHSCVLYQFASDASGLNIAKNRSYFGLSTNMCVNHRGPPAILHFLAFLHVIQTLMNTRPSM